MWHTPTHRQTESIAYNFPLLPSSPTPFSCSHTFDCVVVFRCWPFPVFILLFLFLCACVGCVCVVSFGICFLFCLTFFTFSTRLLIEAFHSFLLRLRVYPYTCTQTYVYVLLCVSMFCCTYVHMYGSVCVCVVRTYIWRLLGAPLPGKCSLILQLVLVKRVHAFHCLCVCVCVYATFVFTSF